jgi:hypothetical protein
VHGPLQRLPELQAFEWIPRVSHVQRAHYEAAARRDGQPDFVLTELTAAGSVEPAGERAVYHPVFFAEPAHNNKLALGLDVGSRPVRRQALQRALDTKAPAASAPVRSAQEHAAHELGMLVFAPVMQQAEEAPRGFALAVLRMSDFVRPAFAQLTRDGFAVRVWIASSPTKLVRAGRDWIKRVRSPRRVGARGPRSGALVRSDAALLAATPFACRSCKPGYASG